MNKLVSAVITTHNRSVLLTRAIESVLSQTYKSIECIVVDDASSDDTAIVCKKYDLNYLFIPKSESKGGNYARNLGIKAANGEYVAFLDDDDYWLPQKIEKQVALIEQKDCELVHCGKRLEIVSSTGTKYETFIPNANLNGDMSKKILMGVCCTTSNMLAKRDALLDIGMFDEQLKFWQEYELTIRLAQRKPIYFVAEELSVYRVDVTDSHRLTNKYTPWKKAVKYIYEKHNILYSKLNIIEKMARYGFVLCDGSVRLKNAGRKIESFFTQIFGLLLKIPYKISLYIFRK